MGSLDGPASAFICTTRLVDTLELFDGPEFSRASSGGMRYSSSSYICGNSIANMSSTLLCATVRSRSNAIQSGSLEDKVALLRLVLSGSIDCVLFRICGKRRDVDRSSRIVFGVQREALPRGQVQNVLFDGFYDRDQHRFFVMHFSPPCLLRSSKILQRVRD